MSASKAAESGGIMTLENIKEAGSQTGAEAHGSAASNGRLKPPSSTVVSAFFPALLALLLFAPSLTAQSPKAVTDPAQITAREKFDVQPFSIDKLFSARVTGSSSWSPDGKQVAFVSNISGRQNIWVVPAEGGWPQQLTVSNQRQTGIAWSPNGRWIAYNSDYDGNEQWDLFLVSPESGQVVNLTNTPEIAEIDPSWSPDGLFLAYAVKPKDSPTYEIDVMEVATKQVRHITTNTPKEFSDELPLWSRDGKFLIFSQEHADGQNSNVFMADAAGGKSILLTPHEGNLRYLATAISPDGKSILLTSNAGNGYDNAGLLDIASKKIRWLTQDKWEISGESFSPDGKFLTYTANVDGNTDIYLYDVASGKAHALPLPKGVNHAAGRPSPFTRDSSRLLYDHNGPDAPQDIWIYDFTAAKAHQVTHSLVGGVRSQDMVEPQLVHYPTKDGKWTISAFVYVPYNLPHNAEHPAIVYVHGGPTAQTMNTFNRFVQYMANQGYIVIAPNYRGSTGYGKQFQQA